MKTPSHGVFAIARTRSTRRYLLLTLGVGLGSFLLIARLPAQPPWSGWRTAAELRRVAAGPKTLE